MIKCYIDSQGCPRAMADDLAYKSIVAYLEQDVQSSLVTVNDLLKSVSQVESGEIRNWQGTGNAHTVTLSSCEVEIENEFDDSQYLSISLDEYRKVLLSWKSLISSITSDQQQ